MTLEEFKKALERLDWYYDFSDDYNKVRRGEENLERLKGIAETNKEFGLMFQQAWEFHFNKEKFVK